MNFIGGKSALLLVAMSVVFTSCQSTKGAKTKTIAADLPEERRTIIYADSGVVYKKICDLPVMLPLQSDCPSGYEPNLISIETFFDKIDLDIGKFDMSAKGLNDVEIAINEAQEQVTQGNVRAIELLQNFRAIKANLKRLVEIREGLVVTNKTFTLKSTPSTFAMLSKVFDSRTTVEIITSERVSDSQ